MGMLKGQDILLTLKLLALGDSAGQGGGADSEFGSLDGIRDGSPSDPQTEGWASAKSKVHGLTYAQLGAALGLSASQVHDAAKRAMKSGLIDRGLKPRRRAIFELLVHGVKFFLPAENGGPARGLPTGHGAEPLSKLISSDGEPPPVWPFAEGTTRGFALQPIYKTVPFAALRDHVLHEYLALVDAVRSGRAREVNAACQELERRLGAGR